MCSITPFLLLGLAILSFSEIEFASAEGKNWALIHVGLDYYPYSYAYEAGAYKQYNALVKAGIPPENIIVVSPDTAAFSSYNHMPGLIAYAYDKEDFSADEPVNEYKDVKIDYSSPDLKMKDFFDIIEGRPNANLTELGSGRVIKSGPEDNIFLYFHTIGTTSFFFLNYYSLLYVDKFIPFLESLSEKKKFNKMFIHMHSSAAGSFFDNYLDTDKRIIVYSLGGRYNTFNMCHENEFLEAYTSTCQGYEHFKYLDKATSQNGAKETVLDLFSGSGLVARDKNVVHNLYGDFSLAREPIKSFYGPKLKNSKSISAAEIEEMRNDKKVKAKQEDDIIQLLTEDTKVPKEEKLKIEENMEKIVSQSIKDEKIPRSKVDERVEHIPLKNFDCYRDAIETIRSKCFTQKSRFIFLKYASKFAQLCNLNVAKDKILKTINSVC